MKGITDRHLVLALFNSVIDEDAFLPLLTGLPGLLCIGNPPEQKLFGEKMALLQLQPALVILSSRLYPESRPELVREINKLYPGAEILLVTLATDPLPPLQQLAADSIRHLLVTPTADDESGIASLHEAITRLLVRSPWELHDYVSAGSPVHEFSLTSSNEKESLIAALVTTISGDSEEMELLRQRAALLADEMVENALYGAPQGDDGRKLYSKGENRAIDADEKIKFRFAFDGETLAMEITDGWGTLAPGMVVDFLARNQDGMETAQEEVGGRGLFIIWRFLDHLHVNILPGMQTVLGGHLKASSPLDCESPKGFSISTDYNYL